MPSMTLTCHVCNLPMQRTKTSAPQGIASHFACREQHGPSGYRKGCRCDVCKAGQNQKCGEYAKKRALADGISPSARYRREQRGVDPLATVTCILCGKPLRYIRTDQVAEPKHKACKNTPQWKRDGLPDPKIARAAKRVGGPKPKVDQRSDLRAGYEDGDYERFLRGLTAKVSIIESGCWEWQGQSNDGYPRLRIGGKEMQVHRLVIEAREGMPLGVLAAHHKCGNSICVRPEHLQPVTHRENVAEMLTRNSLEARIAELEAALEGLDSIHPVLNRVRHKAA